MRPPHGAWAVLLGLAGCLLSVPAVAHACSLDAQPSAYADGQRDRVNTQVPTTSAQLAGWAPFVFARDYPVRHAIVLTEDRREVARTLTAAAMRRPWRWEFGDGQVAYGWTVRHAYAHPGHWRISVDAYDPGIRQWYNFDQVVITVMATPRHFGSTGTRPPATPATHTGCAGPALTTPTNVIQAYYQAVNRRAYTCARRYLAPVAPDVYNVLFGPISGTAGRVTIVRLTSARYRIRTRRATYTCVGAQLLARQWDHSAASYGGWYMAQVNGRAGWHLLVQGTQMALGGVLYIPSRALCAGGIPSPRSGVVRRIAQGGTRSPAQSPELVAAGQVRRGRIYDRNGVLLAGTVANARGIVTRTYRDPSLVQTVGYDSDLYGKSGIEAAFDSYLAGRSSGSGWAELVNRSLRRPIVGDDVRLTIDEHLQQAVASALPDSPSAAVVADPRSGEILALVSKPYYDPNQLNGSLVAPAAPPARAVAYWNALQAAGANPFTNRVTNELLTPGSTFKTVTLASALASGVASLATPYTGQAATGPITVDGQVLDPATNLPPGVTSVDLLHAFVYSDNVAFAEAGLKLGVKRFLAYAHRFGMGRPVPFDLPVAISQVQNPHERLTGVALAGDAFGQGEDRVTPLHMLMVAEGIANRGRIPNPVLVKEVTAPGGAIVRREHHGTFAMAVGRSAAADAAKAMVLVVRGWSGFKTQLRGIQVAGKTGTAATDDGLPPHAWFICFAPADHPRVAVAVVVEHGGEGAFVAAPIALHILQAALSRTGDPVTRDLAGLYAAVVIGLLGIAWLMVVLRRRALLTVAGMVRLGALSALTYLTARELMHDHTLLAVLLAAGLSSFDRRLLIALAASMLLMILAWLGISISPTLDPLGSVAITAAAVLVLTDPSLLAARGPHRSMARKRRRVRRLWLALPACVAGLSLVLAAAGVVYLSTLPSVDDAAARVTKRLHTYGEVDSGLPVRARVGQAVVAVEDRRFYSHGAIDLLGTLRAAAVDLMAASVQQGGSSIAQQVVKALYLPHEDTANAEPGITDLLSGLGRKLEEMGLAVKLEKRYSKAQILQMYLNSVYFGEWLGVAQASQAYFGKAPSALDWAEASLLAGLPRAPGKYNPTLDYMLARERQRAVLDALVRAGTLSRAEADAAYAHLPALPALPTPPPALLAAVATEYQATSPHQMANLSARLGRAAASLSRWWNWTSTTAPGAWAPAVALLTGGSSDPVAARALVQDVYERLGARPDWAAVDRLMPPSSSAVAPWRVDYAGAVAVPSPSFWPAHRPYDRAVRYVVIHDTESSCAAALNTFINPASEASAHFLVCRDGRIYQLVPVADVALHTGNRYINDHSIGIELEGYAGGPYTRAQYLASASLLRWIDAHLHLHLQWTRNAIFGHENVPGDDHTDPGLGWDWPFFMDLLHGTGPYPSPARRVYACADGACAMLGTANWGEPSSFQGGDARLAVVVAPSTPVYACADEACAMLGTANWGEQFHVWVRVPGWIGIDFGGAYGWLAASDAIAGRGTVVRNTWHHPVPVRAAPAPWGRVIGQIAAGEAYASTLIDEGADHRRWWLVAYGHHYAYVCTCDVVRDLRTSPPPFVASAALATRSASHLIAVRRLIETTAQRFGVDPAFAAAIAWQESGFNEGSRSATGAVGIMQVEPGTGQMVARLLKRPLDLTREQDNVTAGVYWLAYLLGSYQGDEERAAAAYYEGAGNLARYGYFASTRQYVDAVMALRASFAYHGRSSGDLPALSAWRIVHGSPNSGVPWSVQNAIDWCGKQPLANTPANRAKGVVWLTFDDGGSPTQVRSILATLKHYGVRGRFFLIGQWANAHPNLVKQMRAEGHFVGNHTLSHARLFQVRAVTGAPDRWLVADQPQSLIEQEIAGGVPSTLFRFPYGAYDDWTLWIMSRVKGPDGQPVEACGWTDDSLDWDGALTPTPASELKRIEAGISPNAVVLMHLHGRFTPQILPSLIDWLHANGYRTEPLRSASSG